MRIVARTESTFIFLLSAETQKQKKTSYILYKVVNSYY
jgi:hypothetical protein